MQNANDTTSTADDLLKKLRRGVGCDWAQYTLTGAEIQIVVDAIANRAATVPGDTIALPPQVVIARTGLADLVNRMRTYADDLARDRVIVPREYGLLHQAADTLVLLDLTLHRIATGQIPNRAATEVPDESAIRHVAEEIADLAVGERHNELMYERICNFAADQIAALYPCSPVANRAVADLEAENQELRVLLADERAAHRVCVEMRDEAERKSPDCGEVDRLRERCLAYKGQVEAGSIAIQHLQGEIDRLRASPDSNAIADVTAERQRQREQEGCTVEHDDSHDEGQMAHAAAAYVLEDTRHWPWGDEWWKPKDRRRNLVRAAALLVAEIERLDRITSG